MTKLLGKYVKINSINKYGICDWIYEDGSLHIVLNSFYEYHVEKKDIKKEIVVKY
jgi:hypothetical protein